MINIIILPEEEYSYETIAASDLNGDGFINVLDVVLTVNLILCADCPDNYNECSDINGDEQINVLDVVSLVNIILGRI